MLTIVVTRHTGQGGGIKGSVTVVAVIFGWYFLGREDIGTVLATKNHRGHCLHTGRGSVEEEGTHSSRGFRSGGDSAAAGPPKGGVLRL